MKKVKISPFRYHDYRRYINDWMQANKISLRQLSSIVQVKPSYLSRVLNNKQELSLDEKKLGLFKLVFKLDKNELKHFKELVELSRSESHSKKIEIYNQILKDENYANANTNEAETYSYLNHWYYVALKEYFELENTPVDFKKIKNDFIFSLKFVEIKNAIIFLKKSGLVEINKNGSVKVKNSQIECYSDIYRLSLGAFHRQMFQLAIESIDKVERENRLILGNTVGLSEESFKKVKIMIENLHEEIQKLEKNEKKKTKIYHFGMAAFPLTKKVL